MRSPLGRRHCGGRPPWGTAAHAHLFRTIGLTCVVAEEEEAKPSLPEDFRTKKPQKVKGWAEKTGSRPKAVHGMNHCVTWAVNYGEGPYTALSPPPYLPYLSVCLPALLTCHSPALTFLFVSPPLLVHLPADLPAFHLAALCSCFLFRQPSRSVLMRAVNKVVAITINRGDRDRRGGKGHVTTNNRFPFSTATLTPTLIGLLIGLLLVCGD